MISFDYLNNGEKLNGSLRMNMSEYKIVKKLNYLHKGKMKNPQYYNNNS